MLYYILNCLNTNFCSYLYRYELTSLSLLLVLWTPHFVRDILLFVWPQAFFVSLCLYVYYYVFCYILLYVVILLLCVFIIFGSLCFIVCFHFIIFISIIIITIIIVIIIISIDVIIIILILYFYLFGPNPIFELIFSNLSSLFGISPISLTQT